MAAEELELEEGGLKQTAKDLFAGAAGGVAQVLLGELDLFYLFMVIYDRGF